MSFEQEYSLIKDVVGEELCYLEREIQQIFDGSNPLDNELSRFLTGSAKRLRPVLGFLFLKSVFSEVTHEQKDMLLAVELIHNATLIHDDVIDKSDKRRNQETFNAKFDETLAVVAGDFLLSVAMEKVIATGSIEVLKVFASALKSTCVGEINQYFTKFGIISIDDYLEKSKAKTALLFQMGVLGGVVLSDSKTEDLSELKRVAVDFSQNFGIAFQIRDDLINVLNSDVFLNNDINSGIYTAPVIFAYQEDESILGQKNILESIKNTKGLEKTKDLMDNYFNEAIAAITPLKESIYKTTLIRLIELLRRNI